MSRLDSFIRRVAAQRDVIDAVAASGTLPEGSVVELGLGNGRTFDHLRERFPGRRIIAFDRALGAHVCSTPGPGDLVLGEIAETAAGFAGMEAALVHADIGAGDDAVDARTLTWLPQLVVGLLRQGGLAASGLPLRHPDLEALPLPAGVAKDRYFLYRRT